MAAKKKITEQAKIDALAEFYQVSTKIKNLEKEINTLKETKDLTLSYLKNHDITEAGAYHLKISTVTKKDVDVKKVFDTLGAEKTMGLVKISQKALTDAFGKTFPIDDYCVVTGTSERVSIIMDGYT